MKKPVPTPTPLSTNFDMDASFMLANRSVAMLCREEDRVRIGEGGIRGFVVHSLEDLIVRIAPDQRPLVLLHEAALPESEIETASILRDLPCRPILAAVSEPSDPARAYTLARRLGIGAVFPERAWRFPRELHRWADWFDGGGPPLGLAPHLAPGSETFEIPILRREDKEPAVEYALAFLGERRSEPALQFDLRLVLEEMINNAILHAFVDEHGAEKYSTGAFERLAEGESVELRMGADARTIAFTVTDNQGRLRRDTVLSRVERQARARGVMDTGGRGLHLIHSLAPRALFHIVPRRTTEMVALYPAHETAWIEEEPLRPLLVFLHS